MWRWEIVFIDNLDHKQRTEISGKRFVNVEACAGNMKSYADFISLHGKITDKRLIWKAEDKNHEY